MAVPQSKLAVLRKPAMPADDSMKMATSPLENMGEAPEPRPPYWYMPSLCHSASLLTCIGPNSPLMSSSTPRPSKPLDSVAKGWSCQACMFSSIIQDGQLLEKQ